MILRCSSDGDDGRERSRPSELGNYVSADTHIGSVRVLPDLVHHSASPSIDVVGAA